MLLFPFPGQHSAGCIDILTTRCAYGCGDTFGIEGVAETLHLLKAAGLKVAIGNGMKTYQINTAIEVAQQACQFTTMAL